MDIDGDFLTLEDCDGYFLTLIRFVLPDRREDAYDERRLARRRNEGQPAKLRLLDRQRAALLKQVAPRAARAPQPTGFQHNIILLNAAVVKINRAFILLDRPSANYALFGLRLPLRNRVPAHDTSPRDSENCAQWRV